MTKSGVGLYANGIFAICKMQQTEIAEPITLPSFRARFTTISIQLWVVPTFKSLQIDLLESQMAISGSLSCTRFSFCPNDYSIRLLLCTEQVEMDPERPQVYSILFAFTAS